MELRVWGDPNTVFQDKGQQEGRQVFVNPFLMSVRMHSAQEDTRFEKESRSVLCSFETAENSGVCPTACWGMRRVEVLVLLLGRML